MKSLKKLFKKSSKRRAQRPNSACAAAPAEEFPRTDTLDSLIDSPHSDDGCHTSSRNNFSSENVACAHVPYSHSDFDTTGNTSNCSGFDEVDNNSLNSNSEIRFRGTPASTSFSWDVQTRYNDAGLENVQNQWKAITRDEENSQSSSGDPPYDNDLEYAQNLQNEDNENELSVRPAQASIPLLANVNIDEQSTIMSSIQQRQEQEITDQAIRASLQSQLNNLSQQQQEEDGWRLQPASAADDDCPDGVIDTQHNLDWSRLRRFSEWKNAAYMALMAFLIPIIAVGYILYYVGKVLGGIAKSSMWLQKNLPHRENGDTTDGTIRQQYQGTPSYNSNLSNPLLLLIFPIMLPIWILQGISTAATKTNAVTAAMMPTSRPATTTFQFPQLQFRVRQPFPRRSVNHTYRGRAFNGNRPCKCRCNQCVVM